MRPGKKKKCAHYSISHKEVYSVKDVAKMFKTKISYLPPRLGERYASALTNMHLNNKVSKRFGKISLKDYISSFIKKKKFIMKIASSLKSLKKKETLIQKWLGEGEEFI